MLTSVRYDNNRPSPIVIGARAAKRVHSLRRSLGSSCTEALRRALHAAQDASRPQSIARIGSAREWKCIGRPLHRSACGAIWALSPLRVLESRYAFARSFRVDSRHGSVQFRFAGRAAICRRRSRRVPPAVAPVRSGRVYARVTGVPNRVSGGCD